MKSFSNREWKSIFSKFFVFFTLFFLNVSLLIAEAIKKYDVSIQINKNGTLTINEIIDYDFGDKLDRRGIIRRIPLRSKKSGIDIYKSHVKMNSVKRNGEPEKYKTKKSSGEIAYKIGSEDKYVDSGVSKYEFNYTMYNAVFEKDGIYQVYFNPIGQFWKVPIESGDVIISFENNQPIGENEIQQLKVFTGKYGETGENYTIVQKSGIIKIKTNEVLEPLNGMTFRLNLKTDKINPTWLDKLKVLYYAVPLVAVGSVVILVLFIYGFVTWLLFRPVSLRKAIVPEFNIPKDISAMYAGYTKGVKNPKEILTIGMLSLLSKGYVTAEDKEGNGKNVKYRLVANTEGNPELSTEEVTLLNALSDDEENIFKKDRSYFSYQKNRKSGFEDEKNLYEASQNIMSTLESKYKSRAYETNDKFSYPFILGMVLVITVGMINRGTNSRANGLFDDIAFVAFNFLISCGIATVIYVFIDNLFSERKIFPAVLKGGIAIFLLIKTGIIGVIIGIIPTMYIIYSKLMKKYTEKSLRQEEHLDGMKMYIKTAEANQIMKFNDVDELVEYFKGILPYAVALGVKNKAIKLLENTINLYNFDENIQDEINRRVYYDSYDSKFLLNTISREYDKVREETGASEGGFSSDGGFSGGGSGGGGGESW
ncbi:hypothetical protein JMUB4039_1910 [Leptotrichia trevisanii]|uniref:DUF2207 domain-containing protein n=1 Tax=Leptotrichia trevisanii TaxID=109328 RepID=UPI001187E232|nr:DUF2207 domain-containing protein [Leptotrichia trevisanii]BBM57928.1 hypothetical protein JMUB4039_1910 [Leptotrichia trevisanii]